MSEKGPFEKSLMKLAQDLGISFSAAKVCYDKGYREALENNPILEAAGAMLPEDIIWLRHQVDRIQEGARKNRFRALIESLPDKEAK